MFLISLLMNFNHNEEVKFLLSLPAVIARNEATTDVLLLGLAPVNLLATAQLLSLAHSPSVHHTDATLSVTSSANRRSRDLDSL